MTSATDHPPARATAAGVYMAGRRLAVAALAAALLFVFAGQVNDAGFQRGHRGWVSAHTLAIAQKASLSNGFVGYAIELATPTSRTLHYFDRYPVFFSAGLHAAWSVLGLDNEARVLFARQVMNLIYVLTVVASVALLVEVGVSLELSIAAAALAAASATMVANRDMVHFDQPALLGSVVLIWAVARWYRHATPALVLPAAVFAVTAGRGYASFIVLGLWWLLDLLSSRGQRSARETIRYAVTGIPARACLLGATVAGLCLTYNIVVESRIRSVPVSEVSIVKSATRRLSLDSRFNELNENRLSWPHFVRYEIESFGDSVRPWSRKWRPGKGHFWPTLAGALALSLAASFAIRRSRPLRIPALLMLLSGPLWLLLMRNVAAFHPYFGIYFLGVALLFFAGLLQWVPPRASFVAALGATAVLALCTHARNDDLRRIANVSSRWTRDMQRIAPLLEPGQAVAEHRLFRGVPFALGFYLPEQALMVEGTSQLVLSNQRGFAPENLTPNNLDLFLYLVIRPFRAHSTLARYHPDSMVARFGSRPLRKPAAR